MILLNKNAISDPEQESYSKPTNNPDFYTNVNEK